jgi:hypothetical protein
MNRQVYQTVRNDEQGTMNKEQKHFSGGIKNKRRQVAQKSGRGFIINKIPVSTV